MGDGFESGDRSGSCRHGAAIVPQGRALLYDGPMPSGSRRRSFRPSPPAGLQHEAAGPVHSALRAWCVPGVACHADLRPVGRGGPCHQHRPSTEPARGTLVSAFVDAHVHLDKAYTGGGCRRGARRPDARHRSLCGPAPVLDTGRPGLRMSRALDDAWASGTRAMRTHLDWVGDDMPVALRVFEQLREQWRGRIELQMAALVSAGPVGRHGRGRAHRRAGGGHRGRWHLGAGRICLPPCRPARKTGGTVRCGPPAQPAAGHPCGRGAGTRCARPADRGGDRAGPGLAGPHPVQPCLRAVGPAADEALRTLQACRDAGIALVGLPTTNLYLQGDWDGTPVERGITRLREAAALGMAPCIATDNVADPFYPYGSYDLFETFGLAVRWRTSPRRRTGCRPSPSRRPGPWAWPGTAGSTRVAPPSWCVWPPGTRMNCSRLRGASAP